MPGKIWIDSVRKVLVSYVAVILILLQAVPHRSTAQTGNSLIISEILANNSTILMDEDGDYSDWIEIENLSDEDIAVGGWYLSDDHDNLIKWLFPEYTIPAKGFLVVFASGKDKRLTELHANFKLSGLGEELFLIQPDGKTIASSVTFPPQHADVSYSYINQSWVFSSPTPGGPNQVGGFLNPPSFSADHGFYTQSFLLSINNPTGDTLIYTTDGSKPGVTHGFRFIGPITVDSTTVVRAIASSGGQMSAIATSTYIFPEKVKNQTESPIGYPTSWGSFSQIDGEAPADYGMDPFICNHESYKDLIVPSLTSIPTLSISADIDNLFSHSTDPETGGIYIHTDPPTGGLGAGWERAASAEYILPDGTGGFQIDCGIRIHGGHSRVPEKTPKHSFRLTFREVYGPGKLQYPLFGDEAAKRFNSIVLRAGFNHSWVHWEANQRNAAQYIHDSWAKDTWKKMGHTAAHNKFVHLYLNGLYWGLYNISERMDDDYMADYLGGEKNNWDVIKDYAEVAEGNKDAWNAMMDIAKNGLSDSESYYRIQGKDPFGKEDESLEAYLNVDNLIDYMILNFYAGNLDWDHHNWVSARNRVNPDKGFQFFPWDSERIFYKQNDNVVEENNEDKPSFLYTSLRRNPVFRIEFARRANELLGPGGLLSPDSVKATWAGRSAEIALAVVAESARWGDYRSEKHPYKNGPYVLYTKIDHWDKEQNRLMNEYFPERSQIVLNQLTEIGLAGAVITGMEYETNQSNTKVRVFPTPFATEVNFEFSTDCVGKTEIYVYSREGQLKHFNQNVYQSVGQKLITWKPDGLSAGLYYYQIRTGEQVYSGKLVYIP